VSRAQGLAIGPMLVAFSAQHHTLGFQHFVHARQARSDHRVVQCFADQARQAQPQLSCRGFPFTLLLALLFMAASSSYPPDLPIGRGMPPLKSQQPSGHRPLVAERGLADVGGEGDLAFLRGGSLVAEFFQLTGEQMSDQVVSSGALSAERFDAGLALLDDPKFWAFAGAGIAVWGRRPNGN
jgi:hypothetical protein